MTARMPHLVVFDSPSPHERADEAADFALQYITERGLADHKILLIGSGRGGGIRDRCPDRFEDEPEATSPDRFGALVRASRAVIVAARDEGFRFAAEAWVHGTPAVVADCEAASALMQGIPGLYRAGDYASFAASLDRVLAIDARGYHAWSKLVSLRCGWTRAGADVVSVYRALVAAAANAPQQELVS